MRHRVSLHISGTALAAGIRVAISKLPVRRTGRSLFTRLTVIARHRIAFITILLYVCRPAFAQIKDDDDAPLPKPKVVISVRSLEQITFGGTTEAAVRTAMEKQLTKEIDTV